MHCNIEMRSRAVPLNGKTDLMRILEIIKSLR